MGRMEGRWRGGEGRRAKSERREAAAAEEEERSRRTEEEEALSLCRSLCPMRRSGEKRRGRATRASSDTGARDALRW